jgi:5-methylcytosine-specific restriction endonuclease McrA
VERTRWYTHLCMPDTRTYADRADYLKKAVAARRRKLRDMAIGYGGGRCFICGYNRSKRALVFHHLDPKRKDFGLSMRGLTRSWEKMRAELDKCVLLCANCHSEVHDGITQLPRVISVEKRGEFGETQVQRKSKDGQSRAKPSRKSGKV